MGKHAKTLDEMRAEVMRSNQGMQANIYYGLRHDDDDDLMLVDIFNPEGIGTANLNLITCYLPESQIISMLEGEQWSIPREWWKPKHRQGMHAAA